MIIELISVTAAPHIVFWLNSSNVLGYASKRRKTSSAFIIQFIIAHIKDNAVERLMLSKQNMKRGQINTTGYLLGAHTLISWSK